MKPPFTLSIATIWKWPLYANANIISQGSDAPTEAEAPLALDTLSSFLLESHEVVELAANEPLPHLVYRPRLDLKLPSNQASRSQTLLERARVFAAWEAECDADLVDVTVKGAHEDEPGVLYRKKSVGLSLEYPFMGRRI